MSELLGYLERNQGALVPPFRRPGAGKGEAISTAFVESSVANEIIAKRMNYRPTAQVAQGAIQASRMSAISRTGCPVKVGAYSNPAFWPSRALNG